MFLINNKKLLNLPENAGVYIFRDKTGKIIYIGKAKNIKKRVSSYFRDDLPSKQRSLIYAIRHIDYLLTSSESEALVIEQSLIKQLKPFYNTMWRDDKSYPFLKLTIQEDFPRLLITRKVTNDKNLYYGPYPHTKDLKNILYIIQKFFKIRNCKLNFTDDNLPQENIVKSCIYLQTERCLAPCIRRISKKEYRKIIKTIELLLNGNYSKLYKLLEKEMYKASKNFEFEKAKELRDRIKSLEIIQQPITIKEIKKEEINNFLKITQTLEILKEILSLPNCPVVIEGFDVSIISGFEPVGSMVRFVNAKPDKNNYRRFIIKTISGIDDTSMIKEIVFRRYSRLKREDKQLPDLILIDGGKGQLTAAKSALNNLDIKIPIIAIAKKQEEIFIETKKDPLRLSKDSPALQLLQTIRDESHRFALNFHRLRRKKYIFDKKT